jgi:transposase-like protein
MNSKQPLLKWKHYQGEIILLCVRWYLKYPLSYRSTVVDRIREELNTESDGTRNS